MKSFLQPRFSVSLYDYCFRSISKISSLLSALALLEVPLHHFWNIVGSMICRPRSLIGYNTLDDYLYSTTQSGYFSSNGNRTQSLLSKGLLPFALRRLFLAVLSIDND